MRMVGSSQARVEFSSLLDAAAHGEEIVLTRYGVPIAMLIPPAEQPLSPDAAVDALLQFREGITLGGLSVREMIEEGRR
jgi:prevent-host-death family protein